MRRLMILALAIVLPAIGCERAGPPAPAPVSVPAAPASISGQIFIALRSQEVIKLSLVDVSALPESDLDVFKSRADASRRTVLAAAADVQKAQSALAANAAAQRKLYEEAIDLPREPRRAKLAEADRLGEGEPALRRRVSGATAALKVACAVDPFPGTDTLHAEKTVATDADGKFELHGLRQGKSYLVAASASRDVIGKTERYFWLVRVVPQGPRTELRLNNRNLLSAMEAPLVKLSLCGGGTMPTSE